MPTLDEMTTVTDDQSELTMSVLMTPDMANFSGNVHGGTILKLLDQVLMLVQVVIQAVMS